MSNYTTGELAKLCGVTVRTVQYYDNRGILVPSALTEGGRRLYSEEDLQRMKVICFLRELELPINTIAQLLREEHPENVIDLLLEEQQKRLTAEMVQRQKQLEKLEALRRGVKEVERFSVEAIGDIAKVMESKKKLRRIRGTMLGVGVPLDLLEWAGLIYGIKTGNWWLLAAALCLVLIGTMCLVYYYYRNVWYICPSCHNVFQPGFKEMFFANHTLNTRKLTCTACGHKGFCVETCREATDENT